MYCPSGQSPAHLVNRISAKKNGFSIAQVGRLIALPTASKSHFGATGICYTPIIGIHVAQKANGRAVGSWRPF
jgi:hypothetical protein